MAHGRHGPLWASGEVYHGEHVLLTLTDYFTKWVETRTFTKKTAASVKEALRDIFTHGLPEVILTDQGSEFKKETDMAFKELRLKYWVSSAYHPQTNGLDERTNQTLKASIGNTIQGQQERWEDSLRELCTHIIPVYRPQPGTPPSA
ncbi:uncharacterized protein K02A2.6-like isoform X1 [Anguilla rostrata]|uniref:uncharacterized protein K02A2.6-like isoform X1 n=1 Tax=Anguilla rostrata TaxID=7938 RepID=UPI0030CE1734